MEIEQGSGGEGLTRDMQPTTETLVPPDSLPNAQNEQTQPHGGGAGCIGLSTLPDETFVSIRPAHSEKLEVPNLISSGRKLEKNCLLLSSSGSIGTVELGLEHLSNPALSNALNAGSTCAIVGNKDSDEPVTCGECMLEFETLQEYMEHNCPPSQDVKTDKSDDSLLSDVETFDGKIVYNPDGSAYIIEGDSDLSDEDSNLDLPQQEGSFVDKRGLSMNQIPAYPQIINAFHVSRNPAFYNTLYGQTYKLLNDKKKVTDAPIMHSYKVYNVRKKINEYVEEGKENEKTNLDSLNNGNRTKNKPKIPIADNISVPTKPILMCFICKLSFGYAKSFVAHAMGEHNMHLNEQEREIMTRKNASAIIQGLGKDKDPLMSFLEPNSPDPTPISEQSAVHGQYFNPHIYVPNTSSIACSGSNASLIYGTANSTVPHGTVVKTVFSTSSNDGANTNSRSQSSNSGITSEPCTQGAKFNSETNITQQKLSDKESSKMEDPDSNLDRHRHAQSVSVKTENELEKSLNESMDFDLDGDIGDSSVLDFKDDESGQEDNVAIQDETVDNSTSDFGILSSHSHHLAMIGTPICSQHPDGKTNGVECPKCDMVLGSSRSLGGHMTMMHSRNSCKTLKCPKCNWHYKYQETLEIHMKEKHPENETSCMYCITSQPHPRLARGETYTCGYKPFRCDVCNYSTTTKGNLSIHMQSDKHLNNIQELQNGGITTESLMQAQNVNDTSGLKKVKPKPTWRCDVCNYETNVARNLRIHMTSEKHTHNMMVLQQNVKHMQQLSALHSPTQESMMTFNATLPMVGEVSPSGDNPMGEMSYNPNLFMSMGPSESPVDLSMDSENSDGAVGHDTSLNESTKIYQCCVCNLHSTDTIESLHQHIQTDRTKQKEQENLMVVSGNYICKLCNYKTNLKANFQLHCKTDKHLQRLQLVNHIREGGMRNEWRLKYLNVSNPIQVKCNACDYYTNSIHKLRLHSTNQRHETSAKLFYHLQTSEITLNSELKYYHCSICNYSTRAKLNLIQHVRSMKHLRNENLRQIQRKNQGKEIEEDICEIFSVKEYCDNDNVQFDTDTDSKDDEMELEGMGDDAILNDEIKDNSMLKQALLDSTKGGCSDTSVDQIHMCPYCNYTSVSDMQIRAHVISQHMQRPKELLCPLCQEECKDKSRLESHLVQVHNVTPEGLQRLLVMVDQGDWMLPPPTTPSPAATANDESNDGKSDLEGDLKINENCEQGNTGLSDKDQSVEEYRCQTCAKTFSNIDALYAHQNELGHLEMKQTPRGPGYLCWKKGCNQYFKTAQSLQIHFREIHAKRQQLAVSERHVYKYRCNQCSLAFKTIEKLQLHSQYHLIRAATKCAICGRSFRSIAALQKHLVSSHMDLSEEELKQYRMAIANNPLLLSGHLIDPQTSELLKKENKSDDLTTDNQDELSVDASFISQGEDSNSEAPQNFGLEMEINENNETCSGEGSHEQQLVDDYLNSQAIAEDSYNDPARKYKCHRCKVAFTKQSYLTSHNKTLLHRKGDKLSYPMEKYLDPNRPYKCEICKESFTQKNILLVHYNSVSHLHKLKRSITENKATTPPADSDKKPYKCNICKVAYSQGSTLDIHMRSVLHQTRASKLQELAMTGQVDLNAPLVEQPEPTKAQQHKKILAEMLSTKQTSPNTCIINEQIPSPQAINTQQPSPVQSSQTPVQTSVQALPSHSPIQQSPQTPVQHHKPVSQASPTPPIAQSALFLPPQVPNQPVFTCQRCNSIFMTQDALHQHQQMYCYFQPMSLITPQQAAAAAVATAAVAAAASTTSLPQPQPPHIKNKFLSRNKLTIYKQLLESYGFDLVMQFNEYTQKVPAKPPPLDLETSVFENNEKIEERKIKEEKPVIKIEMKKLSEIKFEFEREEKSSRLDLPEINKQTCKQCNKQFSSVWVLKAHSEEIHKNVVPLEAVEMFSDKFKEKYDKKHASQQQQNQQQSSVTENPAPVEMSPIPAAPPTPQPQPPPTPTTVATVTAPPPLQPMEFQQLQFPQSLVNMGFGMGMGMGIPLNMNMSLAMNMHPPLIPIMMPPHFDAMPQQSIQTMDPNFLANQQKLLQQQQQQQAQQQKRARTRINDEQLKILRAHFDINNSPSEDQILEMSEKSGLPHKVIKHWFRNTLFKERQRNKDSPYNFSNPPSTTLNLDEYEKTGEAKAKPLELNDNESDEVKDDYKVEQKNKDFEQSNICIGINGNLIPTISEMPIHPPSPKPTTSSPSILPSKNCSGITSFSTTSSLSSPASTTSSATSSCESATTSTIIGAPQQPKQEPGRRANRTRFTDYQIKVLQEYFENNAYPKDDDLEHLSKLLNLSPRVIVVWFQNARQKARKVYENQPPLDPDDEGSGRFQRTPGLNYQCKKCLLVFQRYYELIKHQKTQCFKEEDRALASPSGMDDSKSHSSLETESSLQDDNSAVAAAMTAADDQVKVGQEGNFRCEKCNLVFGRFDLWREHQNVHLMNPTLFPLYPATSPFGMLQFEAQQQPHPSPPKRKVSEEFDDERDDQPRDKRLRTTILPEQLDYLYQKYQVESSPSRKMLENIAREVGLKKRVVQVWFQNTRARERKGQFRAHQQAIHKRCPFCRALFKAKSALESHLATKHADQFSKGEINIDNIPDGDSESSVGESPQSCTSDTMQKFMTSFGMMPVGAPLMPTSMFSPTSEALQNTMKQYYEDSLKKYLDQLSVPSHHPHTENSNTSTPTDLRLKNKASAAVGKAEEVGEVTDAPLDLSKPVKINTEHEKHLEGPLTDLSERSFDDQTSNRHLSTDDNHSTHSDSSDNMEGEDYVYHDNSSTSPQNHPNNRAGGSKRYRTQMTNVQLKVMKTLFADYKTPTMAECEMLGREIGLPKRVVQVWFQNARAKEKKSKLAYAKHFGQEIDFSRPPEECKLCNFKYSHKYSIQDHIFTKKHVDNVRKFIEGQQEAERDYSDPMGMNKLMRPQEETPDPARKPWETGETAAAATMAGHPHLAQLHALGLHSLGLPVPLPGMSPTSASIGSSVSLSDSNKDKNKLKESVKIKKEKEEPKSENKVIKESLASVQNPLLTNPFGDFPMITTDAGFFPYMYAGFSPYYGIASSFIHPAMYAGAPGLFYDPNMHGTPLGLLQVPQGALKDITQKLTEKGVSTARFTQDSKSLADLAELVKTVDMRCVTEIDTEVGFVCKKCHMVYSAEILCHNHQRTVCYPGKNPDVKAILKLVQIQYECRACLERFASQLEYKFHCELENHIKKAHKFIKLEETATGPPQENGKKELSGNTTNTVVSSETRDKNCGTAKHSTDRDGQVAQVDSVAPIDGTASILHGLDDSGDSENFLEDKRAILDANAGQ